MTFMYTLMLIESGCVEDVGVCVATTEGLGRGGSASLLQTVWGDSVCEADQRQW